MRIQTPITTLLCLLTILSLYGCSHQADQHGMDAGESNDHQNSMSTEPEPTRRGMTAGQWAARVKGADAWTRQEVIVNLAAMGPATLPYAERWMQGSNPGIRYTGAELARMIGAPCAAAAASLRELTRDPTSEVRIAAVRAIETFPKNAMTGVVGDLSKALEDEDWRVRYHAAHALAAAGYQAKDELERLEHCSRHDLDARVRRAAEVARAAIKRDWSEAEKLQRIGRR